jgi:hypothetical protein
MGDIMPTESELLAQIGRDLASIKRYGDRVDLKLAQIDEILKRIDGRGDPASLLATEAALSMIAKR